MKGMYKLENVNILYVLKKILDANTVGYKGDFSLDAKKITKIAKRARKLKLEDRTLCWMSRRYGTWCFKESEILLQNSEAYTVWTYYADQDSGEKPIMVVIDIKDYAQGEVRGDLYTANYRSFCEYLKTARLPLFTYEVTYEKQMVVYSWNKRFPTEHEEYGKMVSVDRKPVDAYLFDYRISEQRKVRSKATLVCSIETFMEGLGLTRKVAQNG